MSAWIRDHLDHHRRILNDPAGPLRGCSDDRGHGSATALLARMTASHRHLGGELIEVMVDGSPRDLVIFHVMPALQKLQDLLDDEGESTP